MEVIERVSSPLTLKPYRTGNLKDTEKKPCLDEDGHLTFSDDDVEDPRNWSSTRKWIIALSTILLVINATFASSGPSAVLPSIAEEFNVSEEVAGLTITVFLLTYAGGPLLWAPLSEHYGRRWVFYGTFLGYLVFNFLCAFAPNFAALLVGRVLTGICASSTIANAPGLLVDLFDPVSRQNAVALFAMLVFSGPALGPVICGFLQLKKDWRWVFYVFLWFAGGSIPFMLMIPETLPSKVLHHKARRIRQHNSEFKDIKAPFEDSDQTLAGLFKITLTRPWRILINPISMACAIYTAFIYTLLYMLFAIYPIVFEQKRGWNAGVSELPLLGIIVGAVIGGLGVRYKTAQDRKRVADGHKPVPEDRLPLAMIGGIIFPISMFWFAWTAQYNSIHWIVPTLAGVFLAISFLFISSGYLNYLADTYTIYSASSLAANSVFRSICGAMSPLFTTYMFEALGVAGGGSLIAGIACLLAVVPFLFYWKGAQLRARSKFSSGEMY